MSKTYIFNSTVGSYSGKYVTGHEIKVGFIDDDEVPRGYAILDGENCTNVSILLDLIAYLTDPKAKGLFEEAIKS